MSGEERGPETVSMHCDDCNRREGLRDIPFDRASGAVVIRTLCPRCRPRAGAIFPRLRGR